MRTSAARTLPALACVSAVCSLLTASPARAGDLEDAVALARKVAEAHRSDEHRARYDVVFPDARALPREGSVRIEARSGRFAALESGTTLEVSEALARVTVAKRTHVPEFAARASGKRDEADLLEATLTPARGRVALVACALLAAARERLRGAVEGPGDAKDPDVKLGSDAEGGEDWPRLALELDGRRAKRRGPYAELARRVLEEVAGSALARPADPLAAGARLVRDLADPDAAPRAAFLLGELGFASAAPELAKLGFAEARDASIKLAALASDAPARALLEASATGSWDVRSWARERLEAAPATRGQWAWALVLREPAAAEEPLAEALHAVPAPSTAAHRARLAKLLESASPLVRVEAAGAILRDGESPRARDVLVAVARDEKVDGDVREDAVARLAQALAPAELTRALAPVLAAPSAAPSVRAQVARALDRAGCVAALALLSETLEAEVQRSEKQGSPDALVRDLRVALVQALASVALAAPGTDALETAAQALATAGAVDPDEDLRALAIHALGALPRGLGERGVKAALEAEKTRPDARGAALRAAEVEAAARSPGEEAERLVAIADAACEAPLRSTLRRVVEAAKDARARGVIVGRLRARGERGEAALEALGEK